MLTAINGTETVRFTRRKKRRGRVRNNESVLYKCSEIVREAVPWNNTFSRLWSYISACLVRFEVTGAFEGRRIWVSHCTSINRMSRCCVLLRNRNCSKVVADGSFSVLLKLISGAVSVRSRWMARCWPTRQRAAWWMRCREMDGLWRRPCETFRPRYIAEVKKIPSVSSFPPSHLSEILYTSPAQFLPNPCPFSRFSHGTRRL